MKHKTPTTLLRLTACLASVALLASCETYLESDSDEAAQTAQTRRWTDPAYEAVKNSIPDTNYPAAQIVGEWLEVWVSYDRAWRAKNYYELRSDGTGQVRGFNTYNGKKWKEVTADLRWTYLGLNRWSIAKVPGSRRLLYVAPGFEGHSQKQWTVRQVRFLPPRLYDVIEGTSLVPLNDEGLVRAVTLGVR